MGDERRWFASDNNAATHPSIMEALSRANIGHAVGYGDDPLTERAEKAVGALFGEGSVVRFVLNGTGANVYAIGCFARQGDAVICTDCAHILVDETGAPGAVTGAQLVPLVAREGKLAVHDVLEAIETYSDMHKPRPAVLSLSQPTELGTIYSPEELRELCGLAHGHGMMVHIDGARLSNAAVGLGVDLKATVGDADVVCFGGTKNGLMYGEAVVFMPRAAGSLPDTARLRKTRLQLASKMRFIAAQFEEYVRDGLWSRNAAAANDSARRLVEGLEALDIPTVYPPQTNAAFVRVPVPVAEELRAKRFFYDWEGGIVRWMASWDTSVEDIDGFLADIKSSLNAYRAAHPGRDSAQERELAPRLAAGRHMLAANWQDVERFTSDQSLGLPPLPLTAPLPEGARLVELPDPIASGLGSASFATVTATRKSRRKYRPEPLSLDELSFLLWASGGVRDKAAANKPGAKFAMRTVPSGGCRHPLDALVYARRVDGLEPGLYRFVAKDHALGLLKPAATVPGADPGRNGWLDLDDQFDRGLLGQLWNCSALVVWTALPYRSEWRYTVAAAKLVLLDAGHACQALYGACEALGLGTCAIGAYDQLALDKALGVDGKDELAIYAAPIGRA